MNHKRHGGLGFTLVELLIVIVVIAILAAIAIIAYQNIQERAYATDLVTRMDAYEKALKLYHIENGKFPDTQNGYGCLGKLSDYPAENGYSEGSCMRWTGNGYAEVFVDESISIDLINVLGSLPSGKIREARAAGVGNGQSWQRFQRGLYFEVQNNSPGASNPDWIYIEYMHDGQGPCPKKLTSTYDENTDTSFCSRVIYAADAGID